MQLYITTRQKYIYICSLSWVLGWRTVVKEEEQFYQSWTLWENVFSWKRYKACKYRKNQQQKQEYFWLHIEDSWRFLIISGILRTFESELCSISLLLWQRSGGSKRGNYFKNRKSTRRCKTSTAHLSAEPKLYTEENGTEIVNTGLSSNLFKLQQFCCFYDWKC